MLGLVLVLCTKCFPVPLLGQFLRIYCKWSFMYESGLFSVKSGLFGRTYFMDGPRRSIKRVARGKNWAKKLVLYYEYPIDRCKMRRKWTLTGDLYEIEGKLTDANRHSCSSQIVFVIFGVEPTGVLGSSSVVVVVPHKTRIGGMGV